MDALAYAADGITITCPSLQWLNKICIVFAKSNFITFNTNKTVCIKYGEQIRINEQAMLNVNNYINGVTLTWQEEVRLLGNSFICQLINNWDSKNVL